MSRRERELDEELRAHLAMAVRDRIERGEAPAAAAAAARREFGNVTLIKDATRDAWGGRAVDALARDARHAVRTLTRAPGFTALVVIMLALGIGVNTAILSAARAVFLQPLPYPDPSRLAFVSRAYPGFPQGGGNFTYPAYLDMRRENTSFEQLAAYQDFGALALTDSAEPVRVRTSYITPSYFELLGVRPALGRTFRSDEDRPGGAQPVAIVSDSFWRRQLSGDPAVVGRTIHLNQRPITVVGVTAPAFRDAPAEHEDTVPVDVWLPLGLAHDLTGMSNVSDRVGAIIWGLGRLKPGVDMARANEDLAAIANRMADAYPTTDRGYGLVARPLRDQLVGQYYGPTWIVIAVSALILLIGCVNVANLLLARLLARSRELAVRSALGASAGRLAQQTIVEHLAVTLLSAAAGWMVAVWSVRALTLWLGDSVPPVLTIRLDGWTLAGCFAVAVCVAVLLALVPASAGWRIDLRDALGQGGRQGAAGGRRRTAGALVVAEVALAATLLVGAGLLVKSLHRLITTPLGFDTSRLLTMRLDLRSQRYATVPARAQFGRSIVERIAPAAGVESVTLWGPAMLGRATWVIELVPEGQRVDEPRNVVTVERHSVNPGGLGNLAIRLVRGRDFTPDDREDQPAVAIVSESLAERLWPGVDALGRRMRRPNDPAWITVVGVARDAHHRERFSLGDAAMGIGPAAFRPQRDVYFPHAQRPNQALVLAVRVDPSAGVEAVLAATRAAVLGLDSTLPVYDVAMLDDRLAEQERASRVLAGVTTLYAALALALAACGLFGVLAHAVRRRTQEIGIRVALGGLPRDLMVMLMRDGLRLAAAGMLCGGAGAVLLARVMSIVLFGVSPADPSVYLSIAALLAASAIAACWIPARRATRIDPTTALRCDG
jgi:putative ABC transport system permease protein